MKRRRTGQPGALSIFRPLAAESRIMFGNLCVEDFVDGIECGLQPFFAMFATIFVGDRGRSRFRTREYFVCLLD